MRDTKPIVLAVDDESSNIDFIAPLLMSEYEIRVATNGKDAIEIVKNTAIDLILLDINMPNMDGFEVTKILKSSEGTKDIPIIFLTASTDEDSIAKAYEIGGADYITKPVKPKELLSRVAREIKLNTLINELEEMNQTLEQKIQIAIEENHKKEQLIASQAKTAILGNMIGVIAHQWKQPLSILSLTAQKLRLKQDMGKLESQDIEQTLKRFNEQISYMSHTIDDFRNYFKPSKVKLHFNPCSVINETFKLIESKLKYHSITYNILEHECLTIYGIENEFKQVILNLTNNAVDILVEKKVENPKIDISFEQDENFAIIKIIDNGGGVPNELLPNKLFESYISTKGEQGTGIGLHISKEIIENGFNGEIKAYNQNGGATFELKIPLFIKN